MKKIKPFIHPATPPKLVSAFRKAKNKKGEGYKWHVLEENIGVNVKPLHDLIHYGKEPTDRTENGRNIRARLFLPKKSHKPRAQTRQYTEPPEYIKKWRQQLTKDDRHDVMKIATELYPEKLRAVLGQYGFEGGSHEQ